MFCIKCGKTVEPGTKFCGSCGHEVTATPTEPAAPEPANRAKDSDVIDTGIRKPTRWKLIVVLGLALIVGIGIGNTQSIVGIFASSHPPLSQEVIYQLINSSIQSGEPLWLPDANMSGASLVGANLNKAYLWNAKLRNADLRFARLGQANLSDADLSGADVFAANLYEVNFRDADLSRANLRGANLYGAILAGANLTGADLTGADLEEAVLEEFNSSGDNVTVKYNANTIWPEGFDPVAAVAVLEATE